MWAWVPFTTVGTGAPCRLDDGGVSLCDLALAFLRHLLQRIVHDAELWNFRNDLLPRQVDAQHPLAGLRVLEVAQPRPDQPFRYRARY